MTREDAKSCICTIEMLQRLAYNIHGVMDVIDANNCKKIIKALEQEPILDKIRAEILDEAEYAYANFDQYKGDILHSELDESPDDDFRYGMERAVEIIDKYKAESEVADADSN